MQDAKTLPTGGSGGSGGPGRSVAGYGRRIGGALGAQNASLIAALALLVLLIGSQNPDFFLPTNLVNIGQAIALLGLLALVQTLVIVSGGLDISVGSTAGLVSITTASVLASSGSVAAGIGVGLLVGLAAGLFNGIVIVYGGVNPVIATLATFAGFRGVAFLVSDGQAIAVTNQAFNSLGLERVAGLPIPLIVLTVVAAFFFLFMRSTDIGRNIYALGGNPTAARLAGIAIDRYKLAIYGLSGTVAGLAGILLTARTTSGQPASGTEGLELLSITAALLGGTALAGGKGSIVGTMLAVVLLGTLTNGLILLNVQSFWQLVAQGVLLVVAVVLQQRPWERLRRAA